mmetsp:Transcript_103370/g.287816  ORF Transcript_103370/g.287816 Transcript_103370/m.287816 type:complete len:216 (-) Transcript_103370:480-1127(-)
MRRSLSWWSGCGHSKVNNQEATSCVGTAASGSSRSCSSTCGEPPPACARGDGRCRTSALASTRPTSSTPSRARSRHSAATSLQVNVGFPAISSMRGRIWYFSSWVGRAKSCRKLLVGSSRCSSRKRLGRGKPAEGWMARVKLWPRSRSSSRCRRSRISWAILKQFLSSTECSGAGFFSLGLFGDTFSKFGTTSSARIRSTSFTACWSRSSTLGAW